MGRWGKTKNKNKVEEGEMTDKARLWRTQKVKSKLSHVSLKQSFTSVL